MTRIRTIVIASGKGGTGKTTVAVNLACIASRLNKKVQYLDCDVEEPNGQFFLKPRISFTRQVYVEVPEVDKDKCTGCGKCGDICQFGAIVCLGSRNVLTFEQLCHSCGGCMRVCLAGAIKSKLLEIGRIETGNCGEIEFVSGTLKIGHVRTPSMVREVKKSLKPDAFSILDTAPGTSCAVVETLKGADYVLLVTEPTPFGLNDLKLAADLVRKMNLPFAVVINRHGIGNEDAERYCQAEGIEIAMRIPDDRRIAEICSTGHIIIDALGEYGQQFTELYEHVNTAKTRAYD